MRIEQAAGLLVMSVKASAFCIVDHSCEPRELSGHNQVRTLSNCSPGLTSESSESMELCGNLEGPEYIYSHFARIQSRENSEFHFFQLKEFGQLWQLKYIGFRNIGHDMS